MQNAVAVFLMGRPNRSATTDEIIAALKLRHKGEEHTRATLREMFQNGRLMPARGGTLELIQ
jgi:ABC-type Fe3+ transport system substrate-binding protein